MDVQEADDDGALQAYLVKYPVTSNDGFSDEWLNDSAGGDALAESILFRYRPMEPEMILQMFGARFRPWRCNTAGGGKRDFIVPLPDSEIMPEEVLNYEACQWKTERMSLLDYLRRTTKDGKIARFISEAHKHYLRGVLVDSLTKGGHRANERQAWEQLTRDYKSDSEGVLWIDDSDDDL